MKGDARNSCKVFWRLLTHSPDCHDALGPTTLGDHQARHIAIQLAGVRNASLVKNITRDRAQCDWRILESSFALFSVNGNLVHIANRIVITSSIVRKRASTLNKGQTHCRTCDAILQNDFFVPTHDIIPQAAEITEFAIPYAMSGFWV